MEDDNIPRMWIKIIYEKTEEPETRVTGFCAYDGEYHDRVQLFINLNIPGWTKDEPQFNARIAEINPKGCGEVQKGCVTEQRRCLCKFEQHVLSDIKLTKSSEK
jgi:hypothetical protein